MSNLIREIVTEYYQRKREAPALFGLQKDYHLNAVSGQEQHAYKFLDDPENAQDANAGPVAESLVWSAVSGILLSKNARIEPSPPLWDYRKDGPDYVFVPKENPATPIGFGFCTIMSRVHGMNCPDPFQNTPTLPFTSKEHRLNARSLYYIVTAADSSKKWEQKLAEITPSLTNVLTTHLGNILA